MYRVYILLLIVIMTAACVPVAHVSPVVEVHPTDTVEIPTAQETPAPTITEAIPIKIKWNTYTNNQLGLTFEYPAVYDTLSYKDCGVKVSSLPDGMELSIGYRSFLQIQPSNGIGLQDYVNNLITQKQWSLETQENVSLGDEPALGFDYHFGGSRFGTATVVTHKTTLYIFSYSAGVFCDVQEENLYEGTAYEHWLESFTFLQ